MKDECDCGYRYYSYEYMCIDGEAYGPCDEPMCGGMCEPVGVCGCDCHEA